MKNEDQNIEYKQSWRDEYPFSREALRELILNALVHKDYASNIPIQISVSDDKIYIANVGTLPDDWTVKKLLGKHPSRPYNPTIASYVYLTGMIETWGRGIRKVFDECRKYGCPPPVYEVSAGEPGDIMVRIDAAPDVLVSESRETVSDAVKDGRPIKRPIKDVVLDAIRQTAGITRPQLISAVGKGRAAITEALSSLQKDRLIEHRGSRKTGGYYCK